MFRLNYCIAIFLLISAVGTISAMEKEQIPKSSVARGHQKSSRQRLAEKQRELARIEEEEKLWSVLIKREERKLLKQLKLSKKLKERALNPVKTCRSESADAEPSVTEQLNNQLPDSLKSLFDQIPEMQQKELDAGVDDQQSMIEEDDYNAEIGRGGIDEGLDKIDTPTDKIHPFGVLFVAGCVNLVIYKLYQFCFGGNRDSRRYNNYSEIPGF